MKTRTNEEWLRELQTRGPEQSGAIDDLRAFLLRAALYALYRNRGQVARVDRSTLEQLAEDTAQEAVLAVLKHLADFRSESKFTTWAYKFAINLALVAARREHWKNVSLDDLIDRPLPPSLDGAGSGADPDRAARQGEAWRVIREVIENTLTERQRQALEAIVFEDVPLDEVARRWDSNRNATYKLLHDARRKLKTELEARGFQVDDVLDLFSSPG